MEAKIVKLSPKEELVSNDLLHRLRKLDAACPPCDDPPPPPLGVLAYLSAEDTLRLLSSGQTVVMSRGYLREIIDTLEQLTPPKGQP